MSVNKVILVGNLGADPEARSTNSGTTVCNMRIATNERRRDAQGNWADHTEWHRVVLFGRNAENAAQYLRKGRQVYVEGALRTRRYQDKENIERFSTEVVGNVVQFLGGRDARGPGPSPGGYDAGGYDPAPPAEQGGGGWGGGNQDEDIPF